MSYDRYVAICNPLHYASIMDVKLQHHLVLCSWFISFVVMLCIVFYVCNLEFCGPYNIDHYFCDLSPLLQLSCSTHIIFDRIQFVLFILMVLAPFLFILFTYIAIFITIANISSTRGRHKTFSTCSSHLMVVSTYYGTLITVYMVPNRGRSNNINKAISLLYALAAPFFNPIIYSLRNKEIRRGVAKLLRQWFKKKYIC
ncbi:olfactory receptor 6P1-like [Pelodytes ibericus]